MRGGSGSGSGSGSGLEQRERGQDAHGRGARGVGALPRQHRAVRVAPEQQLRVRAVRDAATDGYRTTRSRHIAYKYIGHTLYRLFYAPF